MQSRASAGAARSDRALSEADLLAVVDALPANVALWDGEVRLRYANLRQLTRFGRPVADLHGRHLADLVQPHAVELSARYIDGALAGRPQQVERAMVDAQGQRYNAHQVTHVPNVVDGVVLGYCALAVDMTASIEGYQQARRAREQEALRAERDRIAGDIDDHRVVRDLNSALRRLDAAVNRVSDAVPSLSTAADAIEHTIEELRSTVPSRLGHDEPPEARAVAFPELSAAFGVDDDPVPPAGVRWPDDLRGGGWSVDEVRALLDLVPAAIAVWDAEFRNVFANRAAARWFGLPHPSAALGRTALDLLGADVHARNLPAARAALAGEAQQLDRTVMHPSGLRHVQVSFLPRVRDGVVDGLCTFLVDVTARVEAELALQDARAELASVQERKRIADELHNMVIQRLFAASLAASLPTAVTEAQLRSVQDGIAAALDDLESALSTLHENVGVPDLLPALARLVHDATDPSGIDATIDNVGSLEYVPPAVGSELLAAAQAALADVVERSDGGKVVVTVAADTDEVWLRVVDDGPARADRSAGAGAADLRHRAERLGGTCTWRPSTPAGTIVDWRVSTGG